MTESLQTIHIGMSQGEAVQAAGAPIRTTQEDSWTVLWYGSLNPVTADYLYVSGGTVGVISQSLQGQEELLGQVVAKYGTPVFSYSLSGPKTPDSFNRMVYAWPQEGVSVLANGDGPSARIIRMETFALTKNDQFIASGSAGERYTIFTQTTTDSRLFSDAVRIYRQGQGITVAILLFVGLLIAGLLLLLRRLFRRAR